MQWEWLVGPAMGGLIGYVTNDIAVRMLFRPHAAKRLFGRRLPFTPGLIPKERARLANAIGDVLDREVLNPEVMEAALLSEAMLEKLGDAADATMEALLREERTPRVLLEGMVGEQPLADFEAGARRAANLYLMEKLMESGVERKVAAIAVAEARKRAASSSAGLLTLFWDEKRTAAMEEKFSQTLREMLAEHAPGMVDEMLDGVVREGMDTPVRVLAARLEGQKEQVRAFLLRQYQAALRAGLEKALKLLEIGKIVEERLNALDMAALEALILQVIRKELRAIVWLGALLGALLGVLNAVFV